MLKRSREFFLMRSWMYCVGWVTIDLLELQFCSLTMSSTVRTVLTTELSMTSRVSSVRSSGMVLVNWFHISIITWTKSIADCLLVRETFFVVLLVAIFGGQHTAPQNPSKVAAAQTLQSLPSWIHLVSLVFLWRVFMGVFFFLDDLCHSAWFRISSSTVVSAPNHTGTGRV